MTTDFVYQGNEIVKKDVYIEYDFDGTLRNRLPGTKAERFSMFSPSFKRKTLQEQEYRQSAQISQQNVNFDEGIAQEMDEDFPDENESRGRGGVYWMWRLLNWKHI